LKRHVKRIFSTCIDCLLVGGCYEGISSYIPEWFWGFDFSIGVIPFSLPSVGFILVVAYFACKDLLFKNASLGKKIMGLMIVDADGRISGYKEIMKRGVLINSWGYMSLVKTVFSGEGSFKEWEENWEIDHLKTRVIEKAHFVGVSHSAACKGDFSQ